MHWLPFFEYIAIGLKPDLDEAIKRRCQFPVRGRWRFQWRPWLQAVLHINAFLSLRLDRFLASGLYRAWEKGECRSLIIDVWMKMGKIQSDQITPVVWCPWKLKAIALRELNLHHSIYWEWELIEKQPNVIAIVHPISSFPVWALWVLSPFSHISLHQCFYFFPLWLWHIVNRHIFQKSHLQNHCEF